MEEIELLRLLDFVQLLLALMSQKTENDEEKKLLESFRVLSLSLHSLFYSSLSLSLSF